MRAVSAYLISSPSQGTLLRSISSTSLASLLMLRDIIFHQRQVNNRIFVFFSFEYAQYFFFLCVFLALVLKSRERERRRQRRHREDRGQSGVVTESAVTPASRESYHQSLCEGLAERALIGPFSGRKVAAVQSSIAI